MSTKIVYKESIVSGDSVASSPGPTQILSRSRGEMFSTAAR